MYSFQRLSPTPSLTTRMERSKSFCGIFGTLIIPKFHINFSSFVLRCREEKGVFNQELKNSGRNPIDGK